MEEIAAQVFLENIYPGVKLGLVVAGDELMLVDCPLRVEDGRSWLTQVSKEGKPRYVALLDHHPDRVLGARAFDLAILAHDHTRVEMAQWSDSFKGASHPIGAHADRIKRVTGVKRSIPNLTFSLEMKLYLPDLEVDVVHKPGPTEGAIWVVIHERKVIFIGDAVTVQEPPYVGKADIDLWLSTLDDLREDNIREYRFVSSRDGIINREEINAMARFLRKVKLRVNRLKEAEDFEESIHDYADELLVDFDPAEPYLEKARFRLQAGFQDLHARLFPDED
jgi:glyoxylase-like metal-dependent hydrolase (beta-lactamase superfamily II)